MKTEVSFLLQTIPELFLESHQLFSIVLEFRKECGSSDIVQSLCEPDEDEKSDGRNKIWCCRRKVDLPGKQQELDFIKTKGMTPFHEWPARYTHLLQIKGETKNEEIVRGSTTWRRKLPEARYFN